MIRRPENQTDRFVEASYERVLPVGEQAVLVTARQSGGMHHPVLLVHCEGQAEGAQAAASAALTRLLGLEADLTEFYRFARRDIRLQRLAARYRGLKPPRFPTAFEALLNGIACQQFSLAAGLTLLNRLSAACGLGFADSDGVRYAFPRPQDVARLRPRDVHGLGFSRAKTRALLEAATAIAEGRLDLEAMNPMDADDARARLMELRGVGRWTAEYVLLRGLGRTDLFPGDDVGARNNLSRWLHLRKPLDYDRVGHILRKWSPYDGLLYFHMLLSGLERAGKLAV